MIAAYIILTLILLAAFAVGAYLAFRLVCAVFGLGFRTIVRTTVRQTERALR